MPRLKELIQALEMSQVEFAKNLGIAKSTVSDVINGRLKDLPNPVQLKLYREYNVNLNWLLTGEGEMFLAGNAKKPTVFYDAENQTFADEDGSFVSGKEAKKAYNAYLARSGKSPVSADSISLEGLDEVQKKVVIDLVNSYKPKKKGK